MQYRHEWKHRITAADRAVLRQRLGAIAKPDPHGAKGTYSVRSLYFDTPTDRVLREKLDGVGRREKFRIRCYDGDLSLIRLEKKCKRDGLGWKESAPLSAGHVRSLLAGEPAFLAESPHPLLRELYGKMRRQGLRPKALVDYRRQAFVFPAGNVRVTLDYDIRTGLGGVDFLNLKCVTVPVRDSPIILEVKWDGFLPDLIRDAVQLPGRRTEAFSKYAACRAYG